jgi:peptidoglycan/LPS O-acetylase OafA/YrhL
LLVPDTTFPLLAVGWTLIHEVYFYLVFAVFLALRITIPIGLIGWGVALLVALVVGGDYVTSFPLGRVWTSPLTAEFMVGAAIGVLYNQKNMRGAAWAGVIGLLMLGISIVFVAPTLPLANNTHSDAWRVVLFGMPAALIIYWLAGLEQKTALMPPRILTALGDWSYATFLTHVLVLSAVGRIIHALAPPGAMSSFMLIVVGFLAVNFVGAFMFRFFERPTLAVLYRLGSTAQVRSERLGQQRLHPEISSGRM